MDIGNEEELDTPNNAFTNKVQSSNTTTDSLNSQFFIKQCNFNYSNYLLLGQHLLHIIIYSIINKILFYYIEFKSMHSKKNNAVFYAYIEWF